MAHLNSHITMPVRTAGPSDGLAVYTDEHTYCFVCHTWTPGNGSPPKLHNKTTMNYVGSAVRLNKRNISEKTCEKFKIYRDGDTLRFHYHNADGQCIGAKTSSKSKVFSYEGESDGSFFGQHLWRPQGKRITITEGELDAASCLEIAPTWSVVSLPTGAASAKKSIQKNLQFLQGYDQIVLFFDNDEAGIEAAKSAATVLPPGKVYIARLNDYKDASDALQAGDYDALTRAYWDAKPFRPDGIVDAKTLLDLVTSPQPPANHDYPYAGLQRILHGVRYGELVTITAGSGIGKSSFCRELATSAFYKMENGSAILLLKNQTVAHALGLMSAAVGKPLHIGEHEHEELVEAFDATLANWNLHLYDGFGSYDPDVIYNRIEYLASGLDTKSSSWITSPSSLVDSMETSDE